MRDIQRTALKIGDGKNWRFAGGKWVDGDDGLVAVRDDQLRAPSEGMQGLHFAFHRNLCFQDCKATFEICLAYASDLGIILRARDDSHFYLLHFHNCAQQSRAQHFWATLSMMDETGYLKPVKNELVRRVPSNLDTWLPVEVELIGRRILVRVGDYGYFEAEDDTYPGPGHVGIFMGSRGRDIFIPQMRNVVVEGVPEPVSPTQDSVVQAKNWFYPVPTDDQTWQMPTGLLRFPDGELLLSYHSEIKDENWNNEEEIRAIAHCITRSSDGGRSWSEPEQGFEGASHLTPAGRFIRLVKQEENYGIMESLDRGRTWSDPVPTNLDHNKGFGPILNLEDGSMVAFAYGSHELKDDNLATWTWGSHHCHAFSARSDDDGLTWSDPVNVDTPGFDKEGIQLEGNLDLTELSPMQLASGRLMVFIRPIYSPWMWETWSDDGGRSWGPCVRGPFPGYASPNVLRTASGALLVAHRMPWLTVHCSQDEGRTWRGTMIDSGAWAMGGMREVEPDLVLYCYWDSFESLMRMQYIRVTPSGLEPVRI